MDKSWIESCDRRSQLYRDGVEDFLKFAFAGKDANKDEIYCPCKGCLNRFCHTLPIVRMHIERKGFDTGYKIWTHHEENAFDSLPNASNSIEEGMETDDVPENSDVGNTWPDMLTMLQEGRGIPVVENNMDNDETPIEIVDYGESMGSFYRRLAEAEKPFYEGCPKGVTELSFIVEIMRMKQLNGWTNQSLTMFMEYLRKVFPHARIPKSYYHANKLVSDLGFMYHTWDACPKGCMLFRDETENLEKCSFCGSSRYKDVSNEQEQEEGKKVKRVAERQVRYFPLKPRLQKLYWSSHTAPLMRWHAEERIDDGVMRHPADSRAWKTFDELHPSFSIENRNVRLGLATDGFNPFSNMSTSHSTWPVILIPYNLPPWLCMKQSHFIVSTLIDGPSSPGDKIDVFLQPLIDELKELWIEGVDTYDVSTKQTFKLHAAILWTISDFPAYANISGWSTKGEYACPYCNIDHQATRLPAGGKFCYWGHRRFLPARHKLRSQKTNFDGKVDFRPPPKKLSGSEILQQINNLGIEKEYMLVDVQRKRKREQYERERLRKQKSKFVKTHNWKKKSIFFDLPYWEHNLIRHNLDIMHIEKNVCDNVLFTILGTKGRTKDHEKSRKDLVHLGIRKDLHPQPRGGNLAYLPPAEFTLSNKEKDIFLNTLKNIKLPDGYSSNISRCVHLNERVIRGLKSHDNHILMQQLLPIAVRNLLPKHVVQALIELSNCFAVLCSSVNTAADLEKFEDRIALMLCNLEKIFPPGFFDIMEHLPIHLADELSIGGSVLYRWMYPIERYLQTLKHYVRNRARPEASIAKSILLEECMTFCSRYLNDEVETRLNRPKRNDDWGYDAGRAVGKELEFQLDPVSKEQAHRYVLTNTDSVQPFIQLHLTELSTQHPQRSQSHLVHSRHNKEFTAWFANHVDNMPPDERDQLPDEIKNLALGPLDNAYRFQSYIVRGFRFRTKEVDINRKTQNCGVMSKATQMSYSSRKDSNPLLGDINFYGQLTDIIEIHYLGGMKYVLFKCDWIDDSMGKKVDPFKFTLVNFNHLLYKGNGVGDEPFILASQAEQVFYIQDYSDPNWLAVVRMTPRDRYDSYSTAVEELEVPRVSPFSMQELDQSQRVSWTREGVEGALIDTSIPTNDSDEGDED